MNYGIVLVTASSQQEAETIAKALVESRLAACANIFPIQSIYRWEGKVHNEPEWQLTIKTDLTQFTAIADKIREIHSYSVPEIIAIPIIAGSQPYLNWITEQIQ
jgi:periplasmic divalent cation tolerance protein